MLGKLRYRWQVMAALMLVIGMLIPTMAAVAADRVMPVEQASVSARTLYNLRVRQGPGTEYGYSGLIAYNTTVPVLGKNAEGNWILVEYTPGQQGWLAAWLCRINGDLSSVPVSTAGGSPPSTPPTASSNVPSITGASGSTSSTTTTATDTVSIDSLSNSGAITGTTQANLIMRTGPGTEYGILGVIPKDTSVPVLARNEIQTWVVVEYNGRRAWVYRGWLYLDGRLSDLIVVGSINEVASSSPSSSPAPTTSSSTASQWQPSTTTNAGTPRIPTFWPPDGVEQPGYTTRLTGLGPNARSIYQKGLQLGNSPNRFTLVGDSETDNVAFLNGFDTGNYRLDPYDYLQVVVNHFSGSFSRSSEAAKSGLWSEGLFDPFFANPAVCQPGENRIECEYRISRPSVALVLIRIHPNTADWKVRYRQQIEEVVRISTDRGVIPVLTTVPYMSAAPYIAPEQNAIVKSVGQQYGVPVWDLYWATYHLPDNGIDSTDHLTVPPWSPWDFSHPGHFEYGKVVHNLQALEVLHQVVFQVMN